MRFCDKCGSIINLVNKKDETNPDKEVLNFVCNNCNNEINENLENTCVYKQVYDEDFNSDKFINNPYTKYDNTLPRVSNIRCVNDNCITNKKDKYISITDISETPIVDDSKEDQTKFNKIILSNILPTLYETVKLTFEESDKNYRALLKIEGDDSNIQKILEYVEKNTFIDNLRLNVIHNEIIYIKTDNSNLRYMYICKNCSSSWNNK